MAGATRLIEGVAPAPRPAVIQLLRDYEASLSVALDFQKFETELAAFPEGYEPPDGAVILALADVAADLRGLVCIRRLGPDVCEMKRLYVAATARGLGLGRKLANAGIERARTLGYGRMRLDTLPTMAEATALYRSLGFREIANYNCNPVPGALFFERSLD